MTSHNACLNTVIVKLRPAFHRRVNLQVSTIAHVLVDVSLSEEPEFTEHNNDNQCEDIT